MRKISNKFSIKSIIFENADGTETLITEEQFKKNNEFLKSMENKETMYKPIRCGFGCSWLSRKFLTYFHKENFKNL